MATTMPWGEEITVLMELGFLVNGFTLDSAELGVLDTGVLDGTLEGDDVSEFCQDIRITRGRPDQLQQFNAGTCTINLNNNDRRFDPINEDSPYWNPTTNKSGVTPRRKVTVLSDGVPLFTGRITDVDVDYSPTPSGYSYDLSSVSITAADDFVLLANTYTESEITPSAELSGARVTSILDLGEVDYPAVTRNIATGTAGLGGGATFAISANTNVLTYLQNVATSEQGYFYVAANGYLTFTDRIASTFGVPEAYFSDDGTALPYSALQVIYGQEFLYNKIIAQRLGGTEQIADDVESQDEYGISALSLNNLLLESDTDALELAEDLLGKYKQPQYRFDRMRTNFNPLNSTDRATLLALEISDVVNITRSYNTGSPASVSLDYSIEAITHVINPNRHDVEFGLSYVVLLEEFILDSATQGVLDSNDALTEYEPFFFDIDAWDTGHAFS